MKQNSTIVDVHTGSNPVLTTKLTSLRLETRWLMERHQNSQVVCWLPYKLGGGIYSKSLNTGSNPVLTTKNKNYEKWKMVEWFHSRIFYRWYSRYNCTQFSSKRNTIKYSQVAELVDANINPQGWYWWNRRRRTFISRSKTQVVPLQR